jgi:hypothetical protein
MISINFCLSGCAYKFGYVQRDLPGGYKLVAIPVFKNVTQQVAIEGFFTNELIRQFNRSQVAEVTPVSQAPVVIEGKIKEIVYENEAQVDGDKPDNPLELPANTVLTVQYRVFLTVDMSLIRSADHKSLWQGTFKKESVYSAPQVGKAIVNSVNPLYNNSARIEVFQNMAKDKIAEAHDRMTENF